MDRSGVDILALDADEIRYARIRLSSRCCRAIVASDVFGRGQGPLTIAHAASRENTLKFTSQRSSDVLTPLESLLQIKRGQALPLPTRLARLYGNLRMPLPHSRPLIFSNFVSTLDGVVSLQVRGHEGGGDISGFDAHDRMVMGLLRALADAVIVGSGTLEADRDHVWTPEAICPELSSDFRRLRQALRKSEAPLNVIVTGSGRVDLRLPVFKSDQVHALILTTIAGVRRLTSQRVNTAVQIRAIHRSGSAIPAQAILAELRRLSRPQRILIEGGPTLLGDFFAQRLVDEQFLTLAPQIAGREANDGRLGLVMGKSFAPPKPLWGTLIDARRSSSHLFLRYCFPRAANSRRAGS
jgi:riboflavin biosynthesis pyrimidine reductase